MSGHVIHTAFPAIEREAHLERLVDDSLHSSFRVIQNCSRLVVREANAQYTRAKTNIRRVSPMSRTHRMASLASSSPLERAFSGALPRIVRYLISFSLSLFTELDLPLACWLRRFSSLSRMTGEDGSKR